MGHRVYWQHWASYSRMILSPTALQESSRRSTETRLNPIISPPLPSFLDLRPCGTLVGPKPKQLSPSLQLIYVGVLARRGFVTLRCQLEVVANLYLVIRAKVVILITIRTGRITRTTIIKIVTVVTITIWVLGSVPWP